MTYQYPAWKTIHNAKVQQIPHLKRYANHYMDFLVGNYKKSLTQRLKAQLSIFPADIIDIVELLSERNVQHKLEHQELNIYQRNMFVNRCKHMYNIRYSYINAHRIAKDDVSSFFYYLKTYIHYPTYDYESITTNFNKKKSRLLALKLAIEVTDNHFKKLILI